METLVGNPVHVVSLVYRMMRTLPRVLQSLSNCNMRTEVEFVPANTGEVVLQERALA